MRPQDNKTECEVWSQDLKKLNVKCSLKIIKLNVRCGLKISLNIFYFNLVRYTYTYIQAT